MSKIVLDLHPIYNQREKLNAALSQVIKEAVERRIPLVEIIPGKGSGQLMKKVKRFLNQKEVKKLYHRLEIKPKNHGKILVHFRF